MMRRSMGIRGAMQKDLAVLLRTMCFRPRSLPPSLILKNVFALTDGEGQLRMASQTSLNLFRLVWLAICRTPLQGKALRPQK